MHLTMPTKHATAKSAPTAIPMMHPIWHAPLALLLDGGLVCGTSTNTTATVGGETPVLHPLACTHAVTTLSYQIAFSERRLILSRTDVTTIG